MNELKSYTEYAVSTPTADFVIGFDFNYGEDAVNVTVDDVPATEAGYTVVYLNETTIRLSPSVPSGVVRLQRETDIDQTEYAYRAGAKFIAQTMDENFEQLRHSQQEVRDGFSKLSTDTHEIIEGLDAALELAQDAAQDAQDAAVIAQGAADTVNTIIVGGKVGASNVLDASGETQQQVNYNGGSKWHSRVGGYKLNERVILTNGDIVKSTVDGNTNDPNVDMTGWVSSGNSITVESVADLIEINNLNDGDVVYVKGYYKPTNLALAEPFKGGGNRVYVDSRKNENDQFLCINGWVLVVDGYPDAYQAGAKGDGESDDIDALQRLVNAFCTTTFVGIDDQPWVISNRKVLIKAGQYRTTRPWILGAGIEIEFENKTDQNSQTHSFRSAVLIPDFANPLDWAIKTANYTPAGVLQAYDEFSDFDSGRVYTSCNNVKIKNAFIKPVNQIYGGIKGCYAQRSEILGFNIQNVDYGVALTDSWASKVDGFTNHSKCGVLSLRSNNNITIDGYYTKHIATPLSGGTNLIPFKSVNTSFGVFHNRGQAINSTALVCEYNDYNIGVADSVGFISSLYTEFAQVRSGFFHNAKVTIGVTNGYYDKATYELEDNSEVNISSWGQGGYGYGSSNTFVPLVDNTSNLKVGAGLEFYTNLIDYSENNGVIYATNIVDPSGTYNDYTGLRKKWAVPLSVAIGRALSLNTKDNRKYTIELINEGNYNLPATTLSSMDIEIRKSNGVSSATLVNLEPLDLVNSKLSLNGVSTHLPNPNSQGFNFLASGLSTISARNGGIGMEGNNRYFARVNDGSHLKMTFSNYDWTYTMYSALVQIVNSSNDGYLSFIADNNSNLTALLSRGDKGLEVPVTSKVIIPEFMKT